MKDLKRIIGLLGLARRAGKLALGSDAVETALHLRKIYAIIFAVDASRTTTGRLEKAALESDIPVFRLLPKDELGRLMGRETLAVLGIVEPSFANAIKRLVQ